MIRRPPYGSVFLLSAAALAHEILLMRLFSVIQWHHFAYLIIGLALLGYGAGGAAVAIGQSWLLRLFERCYLAAALLFPVTAAGGFLLAQRIPFNAEEILWDGHQVVYLCLLFLVLAVPFFFVGAAICLALTRHRSRSAQIYASDLAGAGAGSLGVVLLLYLVPPLPALLVIAAIGVAAASLAALELRGLDGRAAAVIAVTGLVAVALTGSQAELTTSPYKALRQLLRVEGSRVVSERFSPLGVISVVENHRIPLRHAPGLSLHADGEPPPQMALFTDGGNMTAVTRFARSRDELSYLDYLPSALPYHLRPMERVLAVGAGAGADVLQARYHGSTRIDAVELNAQVVELVDRAHGRYTGRPFSQEGVQVRIGEVREVLGRGEQRYDLIQLSLVDAFNSSSSGLYALRENYLYTVEAVQLYLRHLHPTGFLALTRWVDAPPREMLKLTATAVAAMDLAGIEDPEARLILIRGWQTATLLVKGSAFSAEELIAGRRFAESRAFDLAYLPGLRESETNRFNRLPSPLFYRAVTALLGEQREALLRAYKFDLRPATDDRPFFHHFFKWSTFAELFRLRARGGMPLIEWGYLILLATLAIAVLLSIVLIVVPLRFFLKRPQRPGAGVRRSAVLAYFFLVGLAFMFVEIAFMQKFTLFLHHPVYSVATALTSFLIFAGLGSRWSVGLSRRWGVRRVLIVSIAAIVAIGMVYLLFLGAVFAQLAFWPLLPKVLASAALIAPLGLAMGMPLPLALAALAQNGRKYLPWAWGINGCASVIGASLATVLAVAYGFNAVIAFALLLYCSLPGVFPVRRSSV